MGFEHLLITMVIAVLVMVFGNVFRKAEDEKGNRRAPVRPGESRRGRAPAEVDRILEEIHRRQREAAERRSSSKPRSPSGSTTRTRTSPPTRRSTPAEPVAARRTPAVAILVEDTKAKTATVPVPKAAAVFEIAGTPPLQSAPGQRPARPASKPLVAILPVLQSGQALRTAVVLQEIFGPPRCRRRLRDRR
jgi:hypothetical protein